MTSEANPHYFATNTKDDTSIDQITDAVDFPHTGLIKALSLGMKGNYAVKGSATDFDITQASTGNVLQVAAGKIYRDGAFLSVAAKNFTSSDFQATANTHHLLVADNATPPVLQIRKHSSSTQNKIPPYTEGDTIIAIVTHTSNGFDDMTVQYLTTGKVSNNVSIGYDSSGYNEAMSIEGNATRTLFKNKVADADIRFVLADNTADEKFEIYSDDDSDGDEGDTEVFSVDGTGVTRVKSLSLGTAGELTITESSDNITIKNTVSDKDIIFNINDGGSDTEIMRLDGSTSNVGIGTNSPDAPLHIETSGSGDAIIVESTDAGATDAPDIIFYRNSASPAANDEIGSIRFRGKDNAAGDKDYNRITSVIRDTTSSSADADLIFNSLSNSVEIEMMKISRIDGIVINEIGANYIDTRIESDNKSHMFFVDASADKVGIGNSSPDATLDVEDGGTFRSTRLLTVSVSASTTLTEASHAGRYLICAGNVTLPATSTAGEHYTILNTTGGNITVGRNGNNINGAGSDATVATFNGVTCIAIGSNNWIALGV